MSNRTKSTELNEHDDSASDYLWDRSGQADPEIVRLERSLRRLRYQPSSIQATAMRRSRVHPRQTSLAAAALLAVSIGGAWIAALMLERGPSSSMQVRVVDGTPRIGTTELRGQGLLRAGQWLQTGLDSKAELAVASIGHVTVEPDSRIRLVASHPSQHRLELVQGSIEAFITAPPRLFFVDTPSATAVDLGCRYRLHVDDQGGSALDVQVGWVSLEWGERESVVPAGAMCLTRPGMGPGTPFERDASPMLKRELERFDFEGGGTRSLEAVLRVATDDDSVTLWHLLPRAPETLRERIFDQLVTIQELPAGVTRADVMSLNAAALKLWRDQFLWSPIVPISGASK